MCVEIVLALHNVLLHYAMQTSRASNVTYARSSGYFNCAKAILLLNKAKFAISNACAAIAKGMTLHWIPVQQVLINFEG